MDIDLDGLFAEADEVIEQSSQMLEQVRSRREQIARDPDVFAAPSLLPDLDAQVALVAPPRWHTAVIKRH